MFSTYSAQIPKRNVCTLFCIGQAASEVVCVQFRAPYFKNYTDKLECVQRVGDRMMRGVETKSFGGKSIELDMFCLEKERSS